MKTNQQEPPPLSISLPPIRSRFLLLFLSLSAGFFACSFLNSVAPIQISSFITIPPLPSSKPNLSLAGLQEPIKPKWVWHRMTDEELLRKASMVQRGSNEPSERVPKVAFLFLARGPLPFAPLWEKFFAGHDGLFSLYVHLNPSYHETFPADSVFFGRRIPSKVRSGCINLHHFLKYGSAIGAFLSVNASVIDWIDRVSFKSPGFFCRSFNHIFGRRFIIESLSRRSSTQIFYYIIILSVYTCEMTQIFPIFLFCCPNHVFMLQGGAMGRAEHDEGRTKTPSKRITGHLQRAIRPLIWILHSPLQLPRNLLLPHQLFDHVSRILRRSGPHRPRPLQPQNASHRAAWTVAKRVAVVWDWSLSRSRNRQRSCVLPCVR